MSVATLPPTYIRLYQPRTLTAPGIIPLPKYQPPPPPNTVSDSSPKVLSIPAPGIMSLPKP